MPRLGSRSARGAWIVGLILLGVWKAGAVEPVQITVEGRVEAEATQLAGARDRAVEAAILEAVVGVARDLVQRPLSEPDVELLRESLAPRAPALILGSHSGARNFAAQATPAAYPNNPPQHGGSPKFRVGWM